MVQGPNDVRLLRFVNAGDANQSFMELGPCFAYVPGDADLVQFFCLLLIKAVSFHLLSVYVQNMSDTMW